jgi:hypothetical protein
MAMIKLPMAITIVAIMAKIAILAILALAILAILATAIWVINMALLGIQLKSKKDLAQWCYIYINRTFHSDIIKIFVILSFSRNSYNVN